ALFPEFDHLERTWLLCGKLDYRERRSTPQERFFRAYQVVRAQNKPRGVTFQQDLPWLIDAAPDPRAGESPPPSGYNLSLGAGNVGIGTPGYRQGLTPVQGPEAGAIRF